ncbi:hypothetical protein JMJ35_006441 [Cladonia borealis]|uniref:Uncharacterized protein n=1 Tax=Cladonia borealis TaxID=184061 RepID=A0AA39QZL7_9LECA|nr:hypothetical protein JMJ35_006441 [Cladonia borealis]
MTHPVEILVHVSGPSRGVDDARYRKEASGFLDFEAVGQHFLLQSEEKPKDGPSNKGVGLKARTENAKRTQSNLLKSSAQTEHAPSIHHVKNADILEHQSPRLVNCPPPQVTTPWVSKLAAPSSEISSVIETPHLLIARTPAPTLPRPRTVPTKTPTSHQPMTLRRTQSDSWQTPPSVIPNSQPTPPSSNHSPQGISSSPILKRPFAFSSSPSPTRPTESPNSKRPRLQVPSSPPPEDKSTDDNAAPPTSSHISSSPPPTPQKNHQKTPIRHPKPFSSSPPSTSPPSPLPLEINPPRPPTSTSHFKTHLTSPLIILTKSLPLNHFFHAYIVTTTRPLQTLERGHWLVTLSKFKPSEKYSPEQMIYKFWKYLLDFVGGGRAGFGVRCFREMDEEGEEVAKIYCWGEVVREVWLLLFLASHRKVLGAEAKWVDARGEVVVVMR